MVLVLPPIAASSAMALSMLAGVTMSSGQTLLSRSHMTWWAAWRASASRSGLRAIAVPFPGRAMPRASHRQFMLLAVNMPEQEPQVGQATLSISASRASVMLPAATEPTPSNTEIRSTIWPSSVLPAYIGPPETKIVGMLQRMAAMSMPGTILSQLGMQMRASNWWALTIVSTESAMISRLGRLYFMPKCPMAMPSSTPIVLNRKGTPPASRTACLTMSPNLSRCTCPGMMST